jgi:hypothetical protein
MTTCQRVIALLQPKLTAISSFELILPYVQAHDCLGKLNKVPDYVAILEKMHIPHYQF